MFSGDLPTAEPDLSEWPEQDGDLPDNSSPIQLGTEGIYRNKGFVVAGRIVYQYENGGWNEWHLVFSDGASGWLSDAMAEYAVSFPVSPPPTPLPPAQVPMVTPPWPSFMTQRRTMMFSDGTPIRRPSSLRPDLMAMQSSPALM